MSVQTIAAGLFGLALVAACGHRTAPPPTTEVRRDPDCPRPHTVAEQDSGINLGHDVSHSPRYRVDSAGQVETLPPVPAEHRDTAPLGCPSTRDTTGGSNPP
jgi:hypothetical protein